MFNPQEYKEGDVIEPSELGMDSETKFSHPSMVMKAFLNVISAGSMELREGWYNEKVDKWGSIAKTYNEDTRLKFVESVKTLIMITRCDFDEEGFNSIKKLMEKVEAKRQFWLNEEWVYWNKLNPQEQKVMTERGKNVLKGFFNKRLDFDNQFFNDQIDIYREIVAEINDVIARKGFFGSVDWVA